MKLDMDLVRTILLWMESDPVIERSNAIEAALQGTLKEEKIREQLKFDGNGCNFLDGSEIDGEDKEIVRYHYRKLIEADLVNGKYLDPLGANILDITFAGHQFLDEIRDDAIWQQTKAGAKKVGSFSLETVVEIAKAIVKKKIKDLTDGEFDI